jgi:hypothetical protein
VNSGTPALPTGLPQGAVNSGVDAAYFALVGACSTSLLAGNTDTFFRDMCSSLFSTTWQANYPRLRVFQYGDPFTLTNNTIFNYNLTAQDAQVDIVLTYTAYSFTDNFTATNLIMDPNGNPNNLGVLQGYNYLCMPIRLTTTLASFNLLGPTEKPLNALTQPNFISDLQTRFNTSLITLNGRFNYPPAPTSSFTQVFEWLGPTSQSPFGSAIGPQSVTVNPAYPDHSKDVLQWDPISNQMRLTHTLNVTNTSLISDFRRQENINYLYSYSSLQTKNNGTSFTAYQNSSMDQYQWMTNYCGAIPCTTVASQIGPQGVANSRFSQNLVTPPITADTIMPTLSVQFSPKVLAYLNIPTSPTISINVLSQNEGRSFGIGNYTHLYSSTVCSGAAPTGSSVPTQLQFNITNTSPITLSNLSFVNYDDFRYGVTLSTRSLAPGAQSQVTVNLKLLTNLQDPNLVATPVLFYDSVSWQGSLTSPDLPVLGGFYIAQNFADTTQVGQTPYKNNRFSTFVRDAVLGSNGVSYFSNQNVYQLGEQAVVFSQMKITPLV